MSFAIDEAMTEQTRTKLIQELNVLKIELDRGNKFKDENTSLMFKVVTDRSGRTKVFATTGSAFKLILEKQSDLKWEIASSNQFVSLGNWLVDLLKYETENHKIKITIEYKVMSLYRY